METYQEAEQLEECGEEEHRQGGPDPTCGVHALVQARWRLCGQAEQGECLWNYEGKKVIFIPTVSAQKYKQTTSNIIVCQFVENKIHSAVRW